MHNQIRMTLPTPPSNNNYKRHFCTRSVTTGPARDIHRVAAALTDRAKMYRVAVEAEAWEVRTSMIEGDVRVRIVVYPGKQAVDLDNIPKVLFDALNGIAWKDDAQVAEYSVRRMSGVHKRPHIEVEIEEIVEEQ